MLVIQAREALDPVLGLAYAGLVAGSEGAGEELAKKVESYYGPEELLVKASELLGELTRA